MSTMIERVEAAIVTALDAADIDGKGYAHIERNGEFVRIDGNFRTADVARAAILAMRGPTEEMAEAGKTAQDAEEGDQATVEGVSAAFTAMIDKAVSEKP